MVMMIVMPLRLFTVFVRHKDDPPVVGLACQILARCAGGEGISRCFFVVFQSSVWHIIYIINFNLRYGHQGIWFPKSHTGGCDVVQSRITHALFGCTMNQIPQKVGFTEGHHNGPGAAEKTSAFYLRGETRWLNCVSSVIRKQHFSEAPTHWKLQPGKELHKPGTFQHGHL